MDTDRLHINMSGELFLDALDSAVTAGDRSAISDLAVLAFANKNILWQAAARHADNYLILDKMGNACMRDSVQKQFMDLIPRIRDDK